MNPNYILFIKRCVQFIAIFLLVDICLGFIAQQIFDKQKTGKYARLNYSLNKSKEDILIFGSSYAHRHYNPNLFEQELQLSCLNNGNKGQKILFHNALLKVILARHQPKLIILDVDKNWLYEFPEAYDRINDLLPFYYQHKEELRHTFYESDLILGLKSFLKSYRYNSTIVHAITYSIKPQHDVKGYVPLLGTMQADSIIAKKVFEHYYEITQQKIDTNFVRAYTEFIQLCKQKNIPLLLVCSPDLYNYNLANNQSFHQLKLIAQKEHIPFFDYSKKAPFYQNYAVFNDFEHLNEKGATLFSKEIIQLIQRNKLVAKK